eukprot:9425827-Pyramimonas_sp.AAC.1
MNLGGVVLGVCVSSHQKLNRAISGVGIPLPNRSSTRRHRTRALAFVSWSTIVGLWEKISDSSRVQMVSRSTVK